MNIVRIVYEWPPPWAGLAPAPYEMTKAQVKLGHKLTVFCARWGRSGSQVTVPNVDIYSVPRELFSGGVALSSSIAILFKYLKWRRKNTPDIIHSHGHFGIWIYLYRNFLERFFPWAKELNSPLVVHFHNTVKGRWERLKSNGSDISFISKYLSWPLAQKSDKWAIKNADAYIFVSEKLKQEAIKYYGADQRKCFIVESGVNPMVFKTVTFDEKNKTRIDLNLSPFDKVVLNLGMMVERKNIHILIESLKFLPKNYKLMLLGPEGKKDYELKLSDIIEKNHLESRIVRVGYTPYPEVPIAFQASDIFVLPSSFEGFPKVVLEALSVGIPVLASGYDPQDKVTGFHKIDTLNAEDLAIQIRTIISNPEHIDIRKIAQLYSWDVKAKQVEGVYSFAKEKYK